MIWVTLWDDGEGGWIRTEKWRHYLSGRQEILKKNRTAYTKTLKGDGILHANHIRDCRGGWSSGQEWTNKRVVRNEVRERPAEQCLLASKPLLGYWFLPTGGKVSPQRSLSRELRWACILKWSQLLGRTGGLGTALFSFSLQALHLGKFPVCTVCFLVSIRALSSQWMHLPPHQTSISGSLIYLWSDLCFSLLWLWVLPELSW